MFCFFLPSFSPAFTPSLEVSLSRNVPISTCSSTRFSTCARPKGVERCLRDADTFAALTCVDTDVGLSRYGTALGCVGQAVADQVYTLLCARTESRATSAPAGTTARGLLRSAEYGVRSAELHVGVPLAARSAQQRSLLLHPDVALLEVLQQLSRRKCHHPAGALRLLRPHAARTLW